jgi:5-methylcytosine-specific restriction endonuclease McrA
MAFPAQTAFYKSRAWQKTQAAFMASKNGICERCGDPARIVHHKTYITAENINDPAVTLAWDNLEALCQTCHTREHFVTDATAPGLMFDGQGNLIKL